MGVYQYIDPQTGRSYNFNHAGDAPSNEEFAEIAKIIATRYELGFDGKI